MGKYCGTPRIVPKRERLLNFLPSALYFVDPDKLILLIII
jgi:hypothetical protein